MDKQERLKRSVEMKRLRFEEGWSYQEIGNHFGVSRQRVDQIIGKSGFVSSKQWQENRKKAKDAILAHSHLHIPEIEKLTGISYGILSRTKRVLGIKGIDKKKRFWSLVDVKNDFVCWEWQGCKHPLSDYGTLGFMESRRYAHRVAWEFANSKIPKGKHILHTCDNPSCVNPAHLYLGTHQDNMNDRTKSGNSTGAKLSIEKAREIKELHRNGKRIDELSQMFDVRKESINKILNGTTYQQA